jgi:hypothetical protein
MTGVAIQPGAILTITADAQPAAKEPTEAFAFVMNVSRLEGADRFAVAPGHILRRPTADEVAVIKETLGIEKGGLFGLRYSPWEHDQLEDGTLPPLPEAEWRYFVIGFQGTNETILDLEYAFCLSDAELRIGFVAGGWPPGPVVGYPARIYHLGRLFQYLHQPFLNRMPLFAVGQGDVEQISSLVSKIRTHNPDLVNVQRIVSQLLELEELRTGSQSRFLAYFGILESLLTHKPDPKDPYDSITRQVKNKLTLLDHRWSPRIDYSPFIGLKAEKVWVKMYAYRSYLAHGDVPNFQTAELRPLISPDNAMSLLKSTVKSVARLALSEPQLLANLKDC